MTAHTVADLMTREVFTLQRNDQLTIADDVMRLGRIRHIPVLDDDGVTVAGIVSQRDLLRGALAKCLGYGEHAQSKLLAQLFVKEVMTTDVQTIAPDAAIQDAAQRMVDGKIGCLAVVEAGRLVGILTEGDFVASLCESD